MNCSALKSDSCAMNHGLGDQQHIIYEIYLSDDFNNSLKALTLVNTGKTANPSPPRSY